MTNKWLFVHHVHVHVSGLYRLRTWTNWAIFRKKERNSKWRWNEGSQAKHCVKWRSYAQKMKRNWGTDCARFNDGLSLILRVPKPVKLSIYLKLFTRFCVIPKICINREKILWQRGDDIRGYLSANIVQWGLTRREKEDRIEHKRTKMRDNREQRVYGVEGKYLFPFSL